MWSENNNHEYLVLDHGATRTTKTTKDRTALDFANGSNFDMLYDGGPGHDYPSNSMPEADDEHEVQPPPRKDVLEYYTSGGFDLDAMQAEDDFMFRMAMENVSGLESDLDNVNLNSTDEDDEEEDKKQQIPFDWDKCLPDQMFVYNPTELDHMLDTIITNMKPARSTKVQKPVPANVVFLSARYAHYFCNEEMLDALLSTSIIKLQNVVAKNKQDMALHAFWLANMSHLLYCMRRDSGLVLATSKHQLALSELISDVYQLLVRDAERRLFRVLDAAILEHEPIPGLFSDVKYETEWRRLFGIGTISEVPSSPSSTGGTAGAAAEGSEIPSTLTQAGRTGFGALVADKLFQRPIPDARLRAVSPRIVTTLLSSTLFVLQTYKVHPMMIQHTLSQLFYYLSVVLFNIILSTHSLCCRSKAMQIRMNISALEEWVRYNTLPTSLLHHLDPLIELLQLLQCLSQLSDLPTFLETREKLHMLTPVQIRIVVDGYRYEVGEVRVTEEVHQYVIRAAEDATRKREDLVKERERAKVKGREKEKINEANTNAQRHSSTTERRDEAIDEADGGKAGNAHKESNVELTNSVAKDRSKRGLAPEKVSSDFNKHSALPAAADENLTLIRPAEGELKRHFRPTPLSLSTKSVQNLPPPARYDQFPLSPGTPILIDESLIAPSPVEELKDPDYLLPFSVPNNQAMTLGWGGHRAAAWYGGHPVIPEGFVEMLDKKKSHSG